MNAFDCVGAAGFGGGDPALGCSVSRSDDAEEIVDCNYAALCVSGVCLCSAEDGCLFANDRFSQVWLEVNGDEIIGTFSGTVLDVGQPRALHADRPCAFPPRRRVSAAGAPVGIGSHARPRSTRHDLSRRGAMRRSLAAGFGKNQVSGAPQARLRRQYLAQMSERELFARRPLRRPKPLLRC
jgi:hypothetical protein